MSETMSMQEDSFETLEEQLKIGSLRYENPEHSSFFRDWVRYEGDLVPSPKFLSDLQLLLTKYAGIVVPGKGVSFTFGKNSPSVNLNTNVIRIPNKFLLEGKIDMAIGAIFHELSHIKYTDQIHQLLEQTLWGLLGKIDIAPSYGGTAPQSVTKYLKKTYGLDFLRFSDVMSQTRAIRKMNDNYQIGDAAAPSSANADIKNILDILEECLSLCHFLVNVYEDVRIDAKATESMSKYITKLERDAIPNIEATFSKSDGVFSFPLTMVGILLNAKNYSFNSFDYPENLTQCFKSEESSVFENTRSIVAPIFNFHEELMVKALTPLLRFIGEQNKIPSRYANAIGRGGVGEEGDGSEEGLLPLADLPSNFCGSNADAFGALGNHLFGGEEKGFSADFVRLIESFNFVKFVPAEAEFQTRLREKALKKYKIALVDAWGGR